jgi:hypothetical protein
MRVTCGSHARWRYGGDGVARAQGAGTDQSATAVLDLLPGGHGSGGMRIMCSTEMRQWP